MVKLSPLVEQQVLLPFVSLITACADRCALLADLGSSCLSVPGLFSWLSFFLAYFRLSILPAESNIFAPVFINNLPQGIFFSPQISHVIKIHAPVAFSLFFYFLNLRFGFPSKLAVMGHQPPITHIHF